MIDTRLAVVGLATLAAGGVAYVFIYPLLSGDAQAEKRQKALTTPSAERRERIASAGRREQVTQSLKGIEAKQKARKSVALEARIAQAGLTWSRNTFLLFSVLAGALLGIGTLIATGSPLAATTPSSPSRTPRTRWAGCCTSGLQRASSYRW